MPWSRLALALLLVLLALAGATRLQTSADTRVFFGADNPWFADLQAFEAAFGQDNNILLMLAFTDSRRAAADLPPVFQPDMVQAIRAATEAAWQLPLVLRVTSLANQPKVVTRPDDSLELVPLLDHACGDGSHCDASAVVDLALPLVRNRLASADGTVAGVLLTFDLPLASTSDVPAIAGAVRQLAARLAADHPGIEVRFTGGITMMEAFQVAAERDAGLLVGLALAAMFLVLLITLGELKLVGLTLATVLVAVLVPMGAAGWAGLLLNSATAAAPLVITTLVIATNVHLYLTFRNNVSRDGLSTATAAEGAVAVNRRPILLTALTTGISFLAMLSADSPPLRQLGLLVAGGIATGTVVTLWLIPHLLPRIGRLYVLPSARWTGRLAASMAHWPPRVTAPVVLLLAVASCLGLARLDVDDDFIEYFDHSFEFRQHAEFAQARFAGPNHLDLVVDSGADRGAYTPAHLATLRALSAWLLEQRHVASVVTLADVVDEVGGHLSAEPPASWSADLVAQLVLVYEMGLEDNHDLTDLINIDQSASRVAVLLNGGKSGSIQALQLAINRWAADHAPPGTGVTVTGINIPTAWLALHNIKAMLLSTLVSLVLILAVVGLWFRSTAVLGFGLLAIAAPVAMGFGLWGWLFGSIGLAGAVITAMTIGIIIDDAIHIIYRHAHARRALGMDPAAATRHTLRTVGNAVLITSIALITGFGLLLASGFQINSQLGLATAIIVACALLVDFFLLPPLLRGWRRGPPPTRRH